MKLTWLGHASFLIETDSGLKIVTDPYGQDILAHTAPRADIVTKSHEHFDHNAVDTLPGYDTLLSGEGEWHFEGLTVKGLPCFHDEVRGAKRGANTVFIFEADGQKVVHLGDLGHMPDDALLKAISGADALLIPVGGVYTVDGKQAAELIRLAAPVCAVPMHFLLPEHSMKVLDDGSLFLSSLDASFPVRNESELLLPAEKGVVVLKAH